MYFHLSNRIQKSSTVNAKNDSNVLRYWSNDEVERLKQLKDRGRSDAQIGKVLNRTTMAITCKWNKIKKLRHSITPFCLLFILNIFKFTCL